MKVLDKSWHVQCIKCSDCQCLLRESVSHVLTSFTVDQISSSKAFYTLIYEYS